MRRERGKPYEEQRDGMGWEKVKKWERDRHGEGIGRDDEER